MRLGQLARKLAIRPIEIVNFFAKHQIQIDEDANTKLEDDQVKMVYKEYGQPEQEEVTDPVLETHPVSPTELTPASSETSVPTEHSNTELLASEEIELIKAPKIELSGLKVLGKIELPETKKKELSPEPPLETTSEETEKPRPDTRRTFDPRRNRPQAPRKNPIALQREREEKENAEKRRAELEREKERRAIHYMKKVKPAPPTKRVRMVDEPVEEFSQEALVEEPKTWWGRFMRWLNT